jgi:MoaA/NifB/PqqE/SkfB family radical SAM enzyme
MYPDLFEYIKVLQPRKNFISLSTNATMLSKEIAKRLKSSGVDSLTISIDSYHRDTSVAIYAARLAKTEGLNVVFATMADGDLKYAESIARQFNSRLVVILPADIGGLSHAALLPQEKIKEVYDFCRTSDYATTDLSLNWHKYGCGMIAEMVYIDARGMIKPCPFLKRSIGNMQYLKSRIQKARKQYKLYNKFCEAGEGKCTRFI